MSVVRRGAVGAVVVGLVLLGGPAWAQEDPCAPGPDGAVPEMCQSDMPVSDTGTVGMEPTEPEGPLEPCPGLPFEPGDGVIGDEGGTVEPDPGAPPDVEPVPVDEPKQEEQTLDGPAPAPIEEVYCIAASGPVAEGVPGPESAAGDAGVALEQLPRTGPYDRLLALTVLGSGLVIVGAGAVAAGRRCRV